MFELEAKVPNDVRMTVPSEKLAKRKKFVETGSERKDKPSATASVASDFTKKQSANFSSQKTNKEQAKKNLQKQRLE